MTAPAWLTFSRVKNFGEHSEEVGHRKLRPKERMLAKANDADARRFGKVAPDDPAGRLRRAHPCRTGCPIAETLDTRIPSCIATIA